MTLKNRLKWRWIAKEDREKLILGDIIIIKIFGSVWLFVSDICSNVKKRLKHNQNCILNRIKHKSSAKPILAWHSREPTHLIKLAKPGSTLRFIDGYSRF